MFCEKLFEIECVGTNVFFLSFFLGPKAIEAYGKSLR